MNKYGNRDFSELPTERFRRKMHPHVISIYKDIWGESIEYDQTPVQVDKDASIDRKITLPSGQIITLQEKIREYRFLVNPKLQVCPPIPDFTQEFKNGHGTVCESVGEFFKLYAQYYFYGWANKYQTDILRYVILNVPDYKHILESRGIESIGKLKFNKTHGRASFYAIPLPEILSAAQYTNFDISAINVTYKKDKVA
ncbi:MAG: hypothetical protein KDD04_03675 [Sinomicrobium sp.]|nr:hypothetical protein [Sinomicrobium sp.]